MSHPAAPFKELTSEAVHVSLHRRPACQIELYVKASPNLIQQARKTAIKSINKQIALPGFRKGRAPTEMIAKKFPKEIEQEFRQSLADLAFAEVQKIAKVPVLRNQSVSFDLKKHSEEGAELIFTFESEPQVPPLDPKRFQPAPIDRPQVGEKEIDEAIRQMLFFYAEWKSVSDRPIREGDFILIDLDTIEEGKEPQKVFREIRFEVVPERMAQWMRKLVLNAKVGDVLEGVSEADETASEEEKKEFQSKKVRLSILKVEEPLLPSLDDSFAQKVGAKDIAEMRQSVANILNANVDEKVEADLREQVNAFLLDQFPFDLPLSLIEAERKHRRSELFKSPELQADWKKMSLEDQKQFEEDLFQEASRAVRLFYLSRHIVNERNIPITHQEVQKKAAAILFSKSKNAIDPDQIPQEVYALALSRIVLAKAQEAILAEAKGTT